MERMPAKTPDEICSLFQKYMAEGDVESLLDLYDPEAVILSQSRERKEGRPGIRQQLEPLAAAKALFEFKIKEVIRAGEIALMHTHWHVSWPEPMSVYALEVARRQSDGTWRWLIGDPFTIGRLTAS